MTCQPAIRKLLIPEETGFLCDIKETLYFRGQLEDFNKQFAQKAESYWNASVPQSFSIELCIYTCSHCQQFIICCHATHDCRIFYHPDCYAFQGEFILMGYIFLCDDYIRLSLFNENLFPYKSKHKQQLPIITKNSFYENLSKHIYLWKGGFDLQHINDPIFSHKLYMFFTSDKQFQFKLKDLDFIFPCQMYYKYSRFKDIFGINGSWTDWSFLHEKALIITRAIKHYINYKKK